jgi:predicted ribosomally synthesized peptide with nif11-like leader
MAVETALKFIERVEREHSLREQLYITAPESLPQFLDFARGKGFIFSDEDFITAMDNYQERFATGSIDQLKKYIERYRKIQHLESGD